MLDPLAAYCPARPNSPRCGSLNSGSFANGKLSEEYLADERVMSRDLVTGCE